MRLKIQVTRAGGGRTSGLAERMKLEAARRSLARRREEAQRRFALIYERPALEAMGE